MAISQNNNILIVIVWNSRDDIPFAITSLSSQSQLFWSLLYTYTNKKKKDKKSVVNLIFLRVMLPSKKVVKLCRVTQRISWSTRNISPSNCKDHNYNNIAPLFFVSYFWIGKNDSYIFNEHWICCLYFVQGIRRKFMVLVFLLRLDDQYLINRNI